MFFPSDVWNLIKTFWITLPNEHYWELHEKLSKKYSKDLLYSNIKHTARPYTARPYPSTHCVDPSTLCVDPSKLRVDHESFEFISTPIIRPMVQVSVDNPYFWRNSIVLSTGNQTLSYPEQGSNSSSSLRAENLGTICRYFATDIPMEYIQYILVLVDNEVYSSTIRETFECLYYLYNIPKKNKNGNNILPIHLSKRGIRSGNKNTKHKFTIRLLLSKHYPKSCKFVFEQTVQLAHLPKEKPFIFKEIACHPICMYLSDTISHFIMESSESVHELLLDNENKLVLFKEKQFGRYSIYPISNGIQDYNRMINFSKIKKVKLLTHFYEKGIYAVKK